MCIYIYVHIRIRLSFINHLILIDHVIPPYDSTINTRQIVPSPPQTLKEHAWTTGSRETADNERRKIYYHCSYYSCSVQGNHVASSTALYRALLNCSKHSTGCSDQHKPPFTEIKQFITPVRQMFSLTLHSSCFVMLNAARKAASNELSVNAW